MTTKDLTNNIYDLVKATALKDKQNDDWAILSRQFAQDSKKQMHKYLSNKDMSISNNVIYIGKKIKVIIEEVK